MLRRSSDLYLLKYGNILVKEDFNIERCMHPIILWIIRVKKYYKRANMFQNPENPLLIVLMLINSLSSLKRSCAVGIGLSDFHKMTVT